MTQDQLEQQWEIIGLYCVFLFRKGDGGYRNKNRPAFDNWQMRRPIIDVKSWE